MRRKCGRFQASVLMLMLDVSANQSPYDERDRRPIALSDFSENIEMLVRDAQMKIVVGAHCTSSPVG